jgi:hypothetical protein
MISQSRKNEHRDHGAVDMTFRRFGISDIDSLYDEKHETPQEILEDVVAADPALTAARITHNTRGLDRLRELARLRHMTAGGMTASELAVVGRVHQLERLQLNDASCTDLQALRALINLRILSLSVMSALESLDGIAEMSKLQFLSVWHAPKLRSIDALGALRELRVVDLAGSMYGAIRVPSLEPVASNTKLLKLSLSNVRVGDGSLRPLEGLRALRILELPLLFSAEQFLWLEETLPDARGSWRHSWRARLGAS